MGSPGMSTGVPTEGGVPSGGAKLGSASCSGSPLAPAAAGSGIPCRDVGDAMSSQLPLGRLCDALCDAPRSSQLLLPCPALMYGS